MKNNFLFFLCLISCVAVAVAHEKEMVIVTASYKNSEWYEKNLDSILSQDYDNFRVIYLDDCSPDGTGDLVEAYLKEHPQGHRVTLIKNEQRVGAMANLYRAIHMCDDKAVIVIVDGDDCLAYDGVLKYLNEVYTESDVWLTYGQFLEVPSRNHGFCCPIPWYVVEQHSFRDFDHAPSHLRTFYAGLFKRIKKEDLMYEGEFVQMSYDIAMMFPMMEMASRHFRFISRILYIYNGNNPISDHRVNKDLQRKIDLYIRSKSRYKPLAYLLDD